MKLAGSSLCHYVWLTKSVLGTSHLNHTVGNLIKFKVSLAWPPGGFFQSPKSRRMKLCRTMSAVLQPSCDLERNSSAVDTCFMLFPSMADGDRMAFPHTLRVLGCFGDVNVHITLHWWFESCCNHFLWTHLLYFLDITGYASISTFKDKIKWSRKHQSYWHHHKFEWCATNKECDMGNHFVIWIAMNNFETSEIPPFFAV